MNKTVFVAAVLAIATVLAAGLTVLPNSVWEAQANPCSVGLGGEGVDFASDADANGEQSEAETELFDCDFEGVVIHEEVDGTIQ